MYWAGAVSYLAGQTYDMRPSQERDEALKALDEAEGEELHFRREYNHARTRCRSFPGLDPSKFHLLETAYIP